MSAAIVDPERRRLAALGVERLVLRTRRTVAPAAPALAAVPPATEAVEPASGVRHLALSVDTAELRDPDIREMYTALTKAVGQVGLKCVRVCDVAADSAAAVMVFGTAPVPADVPGLRVLRTDPLAVLYQDRARKRAFWERLQLLGREGRG
ncbi:MAG TPA: hypothetical protein VFQ95_03620 [Rhodanobacteraceae bacterium]|nr:hypothetical protein [Rhodanobacteraceae bacterium]